MGFSRAVGALVALLLAGCTTAQSRVAALERTLAAQPSATTGLERWCASRQLADQPRIAARRLPLTGPVPNGLHTTLQIAANDPLGYRHVELVCGTRVLSDAINWYVPERLTAAMNTALDETDTPFGKVAAPLSFTRETLDTRRGALPGCPAATILSHIALLRLPDGRPLAHLTECYTRANLAK